MSTQTVEAFSVSHAVILNGTTGAEEANGDIYGVREGSLAVDLGSFDNTGDDAVLSVWFWFNFVTVTINAGYVPFNTIALITGETITSSGVSPNDYFYLPLWSVASLNIPTRPLLVRCPSKDSAGAVRTLDFVLYKVQFQPINFTGPKYKDGLMIDYSGRALISSTDETGTALGGSVRRIGRLVSKPSS